MPLTSQLFRGDQKLQSCLLHDSSHITPEAVGDHVAKIQAALAIVDGARISASEIAAKAYGHSTAQAVLGFKRARNIINLAYQTQADNIVGKMTIAVLDEELRKNERPPGVLALYPPRLQGSVGAGGANMPLDVSTIWELLGYSGFHPFGPRSHLVGRTAGAGSSSSPPPPPLPIQILVQELNFFLRAAYLSQGINVTPDSAILYRLYITMLLALGHTGFAIGPTPGTLRAAICDAAIANSSGTCKLEYLTETHSGFTTLPMKKDWCGVYAAWVWRQANASLRWKIWDGTSGGLMRESPYTPLGWSSQSYLHLLAPGDVIVFSPRSGRNHHAIVTAISVATKNGVPVTENVVEGNATGNDPSTSQAKMTIDQQLANNNEEKMFYSVDTYQNANILYR